MSSSLKNRILAGALLATLAVVPVAQAQHAGHGTATTAPAGKANATETQAALRDLWVDHVFWVRSVVVATLDNNQAARAASEKAVVANAKAIAGSIAPFYGQAASDKLFTLLAGHYGAVKQYLDAGTDKTKQDAAITALNDNAGQIATCLLYTSDAADERSSVDLGGRRII